MSRRCCTGERPPRRLARLGAAAGSILPGAALALLPKCPLCLAAWLTLATGVAIPAAAAAHLRELVVVCWIALVALAAACIIRRRGARTAA